MALGDAASALVNKFNQSSTSPKIHLELEEERSVHKVMSVGD